jgi:shikimate dehydrogenase
MGILYAEVIGDPIAHSKSPLIHKFWLEKLGLEGDFRRTQVLPHELRAYFDDRRGDPDWRGCNVTIPYKQKVRELLDEVEDYGIGAVNCILPQNGRLVGRNTDTEGIHEAIRSVDTDAPVCLIGAGGAARAAVASLDILAVYQFHVVVRDASKGQDLLSAFNMDGAVFALDQAEEALKGCVGVINATPLGMTGYPPMPASVLNGLAGIRRHGFALDIVYLPIETQFLERARAARLKTADGLTMLVGQAAGAFRMFFGAEPPRTRDSELRKLLTQ